VSDKQKQNAERDFLQKLSFLAEQNDPIDQGLYQKYDVKRGLRYADGRGVLVGLTRVGDVVAALRRADVVARHLEVCADDALDHLHRDAPPLLTAQIVAERGDAGRLVDRHPHRRADYGRSLLAAGCRHRAGQRTSFPERPPR